MNLASEEALDEGFKGLNMFFAYCNWMILSDVGKRNYAYQHMLDWMIDFFC